MQPTYLIVADDSKLPLCPWFAFFECEFSALIDQFLRPAHPPCMQTFESEHAIEVTGAFTLGALFLTLTLGSFSLTTLKEDNPVDIPDFIASIGGFWGEWMGPAGLTML